MIRVILLVVVCLLILACGCNHPQVCPQTSPTSIPTSIPSSGYQNCYCYETEEVTGVLTLTERGSSYTKLYIGNTTLRVYDEFWAAGSYSWQGEPKGLGLKVGSTYYIKIRTKYSTSCSRLDYNCGSWKSPWDTEILDIRIVE